MINFYHFFTNMTNLSTKAPEIFGQIEFFKREVFTKKGLFVHISSSIFFLIFEDFDFKTTLFILNRQNLVKLDIQFYKVYENKEFKKNCIKK